ncbi:MAG: trigger factor [Firmicutes bacterium]|nr:trigger factor [Bacillota bacterium]
MKKKLFTLGLIAVFAAGAMFMMTGCGEKAPYSGYNFDEYVKVGEYKGLEYKEIKVSVSDAEVEKEIKDRLKGASETVAVEEGIVEDGDVINVAFEGKIDGKTFEGGSSDSYDITVGTTPMIDGFVEGLVGKEVGETVTLDLQFPEDYGKEDLNGKDVVFTVTINSKKVEKIPEYNLDFVKSNSKYESLADYEAAVKEELLAEKREEKETDVQGVLWEQIVEDSELIKYPEEKNEMMDTTLNSFKTAAANAGKEWDAYLKELGYTEEELMTQITSYAETKVFQELIIYAIADAEGLEVTNEEYEAYMQDVLTQSGYDEESFEQYYGTTIEEYCKQEGLRSSMLLNKVMDKVMEYAKTK